MTDSIQTVHWEEPLSGREAARREAFSSKEAFARRVQITQEAMRKERNERRERIIAENVRAREEKARVREEKRAAFDKVKSGDVRPSREVAQEYAAWLFEHGDKPQDSSAWHFGRCEIKALMDFVYGCGK